MKKDELRVAKIPNGTVIDHIPRGRALHVFRILGLTGEEGHVIAILMNVESKKLGKKDLLKIEGREVDPKEAQLISLVAPEASLNIITDYKVTRKVKLYPPKVVEGLVKCQNPACISNSELEPIIPKLEVISTKPVALRCIYCGTRMQGEEIIAHLVGK